MHFVHGFCDGNSLAALREYQHHIRAGENLTDVCLERCIVI
jgi:hypothetical protein